jgi:arylsulfatase
MTSKIPNYLFFVLIVIAILFGTSSAQAIDKIVHDAEYYILEAQNVEKWKADDKVVDKKLAEFRKKNGGNPPNILYILIDDIGFCSIRFVDTRLPTSTKLPIKACAFPGCTPNPHVRQHASPS